MNDADILKPADDAERAFDEAVRQHDLTYDYSDDGAVYAKGRREYDAICLLALNLSRARAAMLWNQVVAEKIEPDFRENFYWSGLAPDDHELG